MTYRANAVGAGSQKASGKKITQSSLQQMFSGNIQPFVQMMDRHPQIYCNNCGKTGACPSFLWS